MSEIIHLGGMTPPAADRVGVHRSEILPATPTFPTDGSSPLPLDAELQAILAKSPFRLARMRAIRAEIESGTYETPERLRATAERLLRILV